MFERISVSISDHSRDLLGCVIQQWFIRRRNYCKGTPQELVRNNKAMKHILVKVLKYNLL